MGGEPAVMVEADLRLDAVQAGFAAMQAQGFAWGQGAGPDALLDAHGLIVLAGVDRLGRGRKGGGQARRSGEAKDESLHDSSPFRSGDIAVEGFRSGRMHPC